MRTSSILALAAVLAGGIRDLAAQTPAASPAPVTARPADVASVDAIIAALYEVISGPAGQKRDWDRFRSLFGPGARLIPTGPRPDGTSGMQVVTPEEYAAQATSFFERNAFFEREIGRRTERYGGIVHAFSAYDSRRAPTDTAPFARGINSIQLVNDGRRWFVMTILWEAERPENRVTSKYLASPADDEAGVRAALQHYLNGHATGSQDEMRQAFHSDARMTFVREGKLVVTPIAEYIARFNGQAAPDEAQRKRRITDVEVTGNAATGRIELDYPSAFVVDYMTLLKDNGRWAIIAKSFQTTPKAK